MLDSDSSDLVPGSSKLVPGSDELVPSSALDPDSGDLVPGNNKLTLMLGPGSCQQFNDLGASLIMSQPNQKFSYMLRSGILLKKSKTLREKSREQNVVLSDGIRDPTIERWCFGRGSTPPSQLD